MKYMQYMFIGLPVIVLVLSGCAPQVIEEDKLSCTYDSDCICGGIDKNTNTCFIGNKAYYDKNVDQQQQCPDFCGGIGGNLRTKCLDGQCGQISVQTLSYCDTDEDCIRDNPCCSCGLGTYINKKYFNENKCQYQCECASIESIGKCVKNLCTAEPVNG